jgi:hypothetical protein
MTWMREADWIDCAGAQGQAWHMSHMLNIDVLMP